MSMVISSVSGFRFVGVFLSCWNRQIQLDTPVAYNSLLGMMLTFQQARLFIWEPTKLLTGDLMTLDSEDQTGEAK